MALTKGQERLVTRSTRPGSRAGAGARFLSGEQPHVWGELHVLQMRLPHRLPPRPSRVLTVDWALCVALWEITRQEEELSKD